MISILINKLSPRNNSSSVKAVAAIAELVDKMSPEDLKTWNTFLAETYGELEGQRGIKRDALYGDYIAALKTEVPLNHFVIALQTFFVLICDLLLVKKTSLNFTDELSKLVRDIENNSGNLSNLKPFSLRRNALFGSEVHRFPFLWFDQISEFRLIYRDFVLDFSKELDLVSFESEVFDYTSQIYSTLFPKNLLHALGEFYTPLWLAKKLIQESGYSVSSKVIDPFSGSGVFGLAALSMDKSLGIPGSNTLDRLLLLDINPIACRSSETNLILNLEFSELESIWDKGTPVFCYDAIDGKLPDFLPSFVQTRVLNKRLKQWLFENEPKNRKLGLASQASLFDLIDLDQTSTFDIQKADILATNPPWIGWEYIPELYRNRIQEHWHTYDLFKAKGLEASFLKEDISSLATIRAIDLYLAVNGKCAVVLKPTLMKSSITGKGIRRLSLRESADYLSLDKVFDYSKIKVFDSAQTETCAWIVTKGIKTNFPVNVMVAEKRTSKEEPDYLAAELTPVNPDDPSGTWMISSATGVRLANVLSGKSAYQGRTGVFTGGANAVYYIEKIRQLSKASSLYRNITERAKRSLPQVEVELEDDLVFPVVRGRDLSRWHFNIGSYLLFPHSLSSGMYPLSEVELSDSFPMTYNYLKSNREFLATRGGFAGWEKAILEKHFYALQRIGPYTFCRFKVAWRYIASDFTVAVVEDRDEQRTILPNDKVMFVGTNDKMEAFYLCGLLSSDPIRNAVVSSMTGTQISASAFSKFRIPKFDVNDASHLEISALCESGHRYLSGESTKVNPQIHEKLNEHAGKILGISKSDLRSLKENLEIRFGSSYNIISQGKSAPDLQKRKRSPEAQPLEQQL